MSEYINVSALLNVVVVGLVVGAGLPALFALGVRALAGPGSRDDDGRRPPLRVAIAATSFGVVMAAIIVAVGLIVSGGH
ncbi:hypothetical protein LGT39_13095 [Demequina sp. TTPB684]|uniref:hypothetical protein n=1 Tax=unclassified Demequina TaxID=2620311 RepID=UPI001CF32B00|nr:MULTISPECIES: hypothetical protein [unclassified Demequina]MCB2413780.1 hypothetical protein [Demequina sp. TTPB684]UPU89312.1 hypothetical protein LGT36_005125 [Demequina sp. TMPB413]